MSKVQVLLKVITECVGANISSWDIEVKTHNKYYIKVNRERRLKLWQAFEGWMFTCDMIVLKL